MAGKDHEDGSQMSTIWESVGGCRRASQPHMLKGDSETQQKIGSGTPQPLPPQPDGLQGPGAIREGRRGLQDRDGHRAG